MPILSNSLLSAEISEAGALTRLTMMNDPDGMNFVLCSADEPWLPEDMQWGFGFVSLNGVRFPFFDGHLCEQTADSLMHTFTLTPSTPRFGCVWNGDIAKSRQDYKLIVSVRRELKADVLYETYTFLNDSPCYIAIDELGIYSGFHDVYATGSNVLSGRVNEHIWTGGDLSYIAAIRQNGQSPHMGLITTQGRFDAYHTDGISTSNVRGAVALVGHRLRIAAGEAYTVGRVVLPFETLSEFDHLVCMRTGCPVAMPAAMIVELGHPIELKLIERGRFERAFADGIPMNETDGVLNFLPYETGAHEVKLFFDGGKLARMNFFALPPVHDLLDARADFIIDRQQIHDPADPLFGAFMPYDTENERIVRLPDVEKTYYSVPDRNEARERLAMGAFIARLYRGRATRKVLNALEEYRTFIEKWIIDENDDIWDCYLRQESAKYYGTGLTLVQDGELDMRFRSCNLGFFATFYLELYKLTHEDRHYNKLIRIIDAAFKRYHHAGGLGMWTFDALREMKERGDMRSFDQLMAQVNTQAASLKKQSEAVSAGEVAYEQGNSANSTAFLAELYIMTHDDTLLPALRHQLRLMEAFEGNEPDYHLYHVPIRHWDGFWFGGNELWGDTMPHYWSTASAYAHAMYARATGEMDHMERAKDIFFANLSLIRMSGASANTFIYPEKVDGRPAHVDDPLANDQEYAYYFYLKIFGNT